MIIAGWQVIYTFIAFCGIDKSRSTRTDRRKQCVIQSCTCVLHEFRCYSRMPIYVLRMHAGPCLWLLLMCGLYYSS